MTTHRLIVALLLSALAFGAGWVGIIAVIQGHVWTVIFSVAVFCISGFVFKDYIRQGSPPGNDE